VSVRVDELDEFAQYVAIQGAELVWFERHKAAGGPYLGIRPATTPGGVVTKADLDAEHLIRGLVAAHRPDDAVVGEQQGWPRERVAGVTWVVDPISGTTNFIAGLPSYAVSVAAVRDGVVVAAAIAEPHSGRTWSAASGRGARLHDPRIADDPLEIRVRAVRQLNDAVIATGFSRTTTTRADQTLLVAGLLPQVADMRISGSPALQLCHVAAGWVDAHVQHDVPPWEWAAGVLIAEEAGATVHRPGRRGPIHDLGDLVFAATPGISDALLEAVAASDAARVRGGPPSPRPNLLPLTQLA
jgi:myo-inositol-1(or 4)-monophosphatase